MLINVYCRDKGWLFEDLKQKIASYGAVASEKPLPNADGYICIRTNEWKLSPKPEKTVVQFHGMKDKFIENENIPLSFVHTIQSKAYENRKNPKLICPIGSRDIPHSYDLPEIPTIGFFCRESKSGIKGSKLFEEAVERARNVCNFKVLMIGGKLDHIAHLGKYEERGADISDYRRIDALLTASISQMIPLSAYETLAAGRRVITTPRDWMGYDSCNKMILTGSTSKELARHIIKVVEDRYAFTPSVFYTRDHWAKSQISFIKHVIDNN